MRYADDLRSLVRSQRAGERVKASVTRFLTRELKLVVNEQKSRVVKTNDCESDCDQQQELLASVEDLGDTNRNDE